MAAMTTITARKTAPQAPSTIRTIIQGDVLRRGVAYWYPGGGCILLPPRSISVTAPSTALSLKWSHASIQENSIAHSRMRCREALQAIRAVPLSERRLENHRDVMRVRYLADVNFAKRDVKRIALWEPLAG